MNARTNALTSAIETTLARLDGPDPAAVQRQRALQRACDLAQQAPATRREPIRTLHHFACTGGTLISKCISALPNVQLLSEVDPLSTHHGEPKAGFAPTDLITLLRLSPRGASPELVAALFAAQLRVLQNDSERQGLHLVLRDHAHSHFCHGATLTERPTLRDLVPTDLPRLSLVTVRHPLDSYASLAKLGWLTFEPRTLNVYCRRYLAFLDRYAGQPVQRYEDFVAAPQAAMQRVCAALELPFEPHFETLFAGFTVSGDSGRGGASIESRPPRPEAVALEPEAARSEAFRTLVERLGYGQRAGEVAA